MRKLDAATLPDWPRGLREDLAAAYIGVSVGTLRDGAKTGNMPAPMRITPGRKVWLRDVLDKWLDQKTGTDGTYGSRNPWDDI